LPVNLPCTRNSYGGWTVDSACHWYCLKVQEWDVSQLQAKARAVVVGSSSIRPFWGWNRAKHAVLEATILATRLHLKGPEQIAQQLNVLAIAVEKTAGPKETEAWRLVTDYIQSWKPN
jgi:hypothetical protein